MKEPRITFKPKTSKNIDIKVRDDCFRKGDIINITNQSMLVTNVDKSDLYSYILSLRTVTTFDRIKFWFYGIIRTLKMSLIDFWNLLFFPENLK